MILTPEEMQAIERAAFAQGITAESLMEDAGLKIAQAIHREVASPGVLRAYLGKGHNAGDALVAARHLHHRGWTIELRDVAPPDEAAPLTQKMRAQFLAQHVRPPALTSLQHRPFVLLDGLLGIGAIGPLRPAFVDLTMEMNRLRRERSAMTIAIDLPSGLDGTTGVPQAHCVKADLTLTIAQVKAGLVADAAVDHVGRLQCLPLKDLGAPDSAGDIGMKLLDGPELMALLTPRPASYYKTQAGRVAIIAGSRGLTGAAALASEAALSAGAGLVSLYVPENVHPILATRCPAEIMVRPIPADLHTIAADLFAVGPGLGAEATEDLLGWLGQESRPIILDADALNLLARHPEHANKIYQGGSRLLTPHPGEFHRLFPQYESLPTRRARAEAVARALPVTLLYKGARTLIANAGSPTFFNGTGNPGMATGGMGDVLTGLIAGLAVQGLTLQQAACLGAWLAGASADFCLSHAGETVQSLRPTHLIQHLATVMRTMAGRHID